MKLFDSWIAWSLRQKVRDFLSPESEITAALDVYEDDRLTGTLELHDPPDPVLGQKLHDETVARIKAWPIVAGFDVYNEKRDGMWKDYIVRTASKLARIEPERLSWNDEDKLLLDGEIISGRFHPMAMEWDYYPVPSGGILAYDLANLASYYAEHIKDKVGR